MKKIILSLATLAILSSLSCTTTQNKETEKTNKQVASEASVSELTFGVKGNCGMCKQTIETAAKSVDGVVSANWDMDKKKIDVSFDNTKTNAKAIHQAVANSGYDTDQIVSNENSYENLPECCQYDPNMKMSRE